MNTDNQSIQIKPESLAYWFFRLNGCFTIVNFIVHPNTRGAQRTDADILGVRFPYRQELVTSGNPLKDHNVFDSDEKIDIVIAEVKRGLCDLNGPWTREEYKNIQRVLYAIGAFPDNKVAEVASALYRAWCFNDGLFRVRLFAVGNRKNTKLPEGVVQIEWDELLGFIYSRFKKNTLLKSQHEQWDPLGKALYACAQEKEEGEFIEEIKHNLGLIEQS